MKESGAGTAPREFQYTLVVGAIRTQGMTKQCDHQRDCGEAILPRQMTCFRIPGISECWHQIGSTSGPMKSLEIGVRSSGAKIASVFVCIRREQEFLNLGDNSALRPRNVPNWGQRCNYVCRTD
jgi:hypothetical protein